MQNSIAWPASYLPGFTDNYCSNEVIVAGISAADVWPYLADTQTWSGYYSNVADVEFDNSAGTVLVQGARFRFKTFGFPIEAEVVEYVAPANGEPARLAWHGWAEGDADTRLDVHHAWLLEDLAGGRVRILTQETQVGKPARELAQTVPNPMINGHQDWLDGLVKSAKSRRAATR